MAGKTRSAAARGGASSPGAKTGTRTGARTGAKAGTRTGAKAGSERRGELLSIAATMFATKGYVETTVRDIADEAGILSGSLYHHFSSKEAMLDEILRGFLTNLLSTFSVIEERSTDPRTAMDELVAASFEAIAATPEAVALYQKQQGWLGQQPGFEYVAEISAKVEAIWLRVLVHGQKSGAFRSDVDMKLAYRFIRDMVWSAVNWYRPRGKYKPEAIAKQCLKVLHGGILTE